MNKSAIRRRLLGVAVVLAAATGSMSHASEPDGAAVEGNRAGGLVTLSASAARAVTQDWLRFRLVATAESRNALKAQSQVKDRLAPALERLKSLASGQSMRVRTDGFRVEPRYHEGKVVGWVASAWLVVEGDDFEQLSQAAAGVPELTVDAATLSVSSATDRVVRAQLRLEAIAAFREQATEVARAFGAQTYELVDVNVGGDTVRSPAPMYARQAMAMSMADQPASVPISAGTESIEVNVTGRVRLK